MVLASREAETTTPGTEDQDLSFRTTYVDLSFRVQDSAYAEFDGQEIVSSNIPQLLSLLSDERSTIDFYGSHRKDQELQIGTKYDARRTDWSLFYQLL